MPGANQPPDREVGRMLQRLEAIERRLGNERITRLRALEDVTNQPLLTSGDVPSWAGSSFQFAQPFASGAISGIRVRNEDLSTIAALGEIYFDWGFSFDASYDQENSSADLSIDADSHYINVATDGLYFTGVSVQVRSSGTGYAATDFAAAYVSLLAPGSTTIESMGAAVKNIAGGTGALLYRTAFGVPRRYYAGQQLRVRAQCSESFIASGNLWVYRLA